MFHLGWFLVPGFGVYDWGKQWSGNALADAGRADLFIDIARSLERGGFDYVMFEDASVVPDVYKGTFEASVATASAVRFDPLPLIPLLAQATSHLGIISTVATNFYPPFLAARLMATLDHLTGGRVGVNLVTASSLGAARNYGLDELPEHDLRYEMADEWMTLVTALWQSWQPAATESQVEVFADHRHIAPVDFRGKYYSSRGPLTLPPGPQGRPVVCQAGASGPGRDLGAKYADTIVSAVSGVDAMTQYRSDIQTRVATFGRQGTDCKVLFVVQPILGETHDDALARRDRLRAEQAEQLDANLAQMSYFTGLDFAQFDLDGPMPDISNNHGHQSAMQDFAKSGPTLREIATKHRHGESVELVGTPASVAEQMGEVIDAVGGDGFLIANSPTRRNLAEVTDGLAPELRRRGLIRSSYEHPTFRQNLLAF